MLIELLFFVAVIYFLLYQNKKQYKKIDELNQRLTKLEKDAIKVTFEDKIY
jgi:preprotein translocase subunit YajC